MHQAPIVLHPLLEADEEFSKPVVPRTGALNDPAPRWMSPTPWGTFATMAEMGSVMPLPDRRLDHWEVVPFVETQMLGGLARRTGTPNGEAVQRGRRRFHIVGIRGSHDDGQRCAALVG
jgi:hypothetical protein